MDKLKCVWAVNDGEKVYKTDLNNINKKGNSIWNGEEINLVSGKNETVAFQVIFENGTETSENVKVELASFNSAGNSASSVNLIDYVEIFKEHYIYIPYDKVTTASWFFAEGGRPENKHGWVPDALIPVNLLDKISVLPSENQGFWVDLYIPKEGVNPGKYISEVIVSVEGSVFKRIPLKLNVLDVVLTDENPSPNMVYATDVNEYYPDYEGDILDEFRKMAHKHRFELVGAPEHIMKFDSEKLDKYYDKYLKDGNNLYSKENGYTGSGEGLGDKIFPIGMYGRNIFGETDEEYVAEAKKWDNWFRSKDWDGMHFLYLIDEPREASYEFIKDRVTLLKKNDVKLPIYITTRYKEELDGYVDIWSAGQGTDLAVKKEKEKEGQKFTFYNGYSPRIPMVVLEGSAVEFRVTQWIKMKYNMTFYFYWHGTHWKHNMQGPRRLTNQNVYSYPVTFVLVREQQDEFYFGKKAQKVFYGNGDGTFFYPGTDPFYPENNLGFDGPISSIRMKNMRRGAQDVAYLDMARKIGYESEVELLMNKAVPRAFSEVEKEDKPSWSLNGSDWDNYRLEVLKLLAK